MKLRSRKRRLSSQQSNKKQEIPPPEKGLMRAAILFRLSLLLTMTTATIWQIRTWAFS